MALPLRRVEYIYIYSSVARFTYDDTAEVAQAAFKLPAFTTPMPVVLDFGRRLVKFLTSLT